MRLLTTLLFIVLHTSFSFAQDQEVYENNIFLDNIYTAYFNTPAGELPIITSNNDSLDFTFDDFETGVKEYIYRVIHCNKDWEKSNISEWEYTDGMNEYIINDYELDEARYSEYTQYSLTLPNEDLTLNISGNYILEIYDNNEDEPVLAIRKRFIIAETKVEIVIDNRPLQAINQLSNQEVNFKINYGQLPLVNPRIELFTSVYQNGDWGTGKTNIMGAGQQSSNLVFNTAKPIVFPGLMEYRMFNINGLKFTSRFVESIHKSEDGTDVLLTLDKKRFNYFARDDMNGSFEIYESPYAMDGEEYVNVIFNLKSNIPYDEDVYVYGKLSEWRLNDRFLMTYDDENGMYIAEVLLKQGKYDYMYALEQEDGEIDLETIEGSSGSTLNKYNIIVYYRTLETDYDRVLVVRNYVPFFN